MTEIWCWLWEIIRQSTPQGSIKGEQWNCCGFLIILLRLIVRLLRIWLILWFDNSYLVISCTWLTHIYFQMLLQIWRISGRYLSYKTLMYAIWCGQAIKIYPIICWLWGIDVSEPLSSRRLPKRVAIREKTRIGCESARAPVRVYPIIGWLWKINVGERPSFRRLFERLPSCWRPV